MLNTLRSSLLLHTDIENSIYPSFTSNAIYQHPDVTTKSIEYLENVKKNVSEEKTSVLSNQSDDLN